MCEEIRDAGMYVDDQSVCGTYVAALLYECNLEVRELRRKQEGLITKTKAKRVTKGFMQKEGVDYLQTLAPTPVAAPLNIVTAVANELQGMPPKCSTDVHKGRIW